MELNLDRLNGLRLTNPSKTPSEELLGAEGYKSPTAQENALERQLEGLQELQHKADQNKAELANSLEVHRAYQENIKRSGQLQTDILKGAKAGEDIYGLFLKAVQAISLMTANKAFYSQLEEDIKTIYGRGLREPAPLLLEIRQAQTRLNRLRKAERRETEPDSLLCIRSAIKAHENKIAELKALIAEKPKAQERPA